MGLVSGVMGLGKGKKKGGKLSTMEKKEMPVESDPHKLVNYVCGSNIYTTGEDVKVGNLFKIFNFLEVMMESVSMCGVLYFHHIKIQLHAKTQALTYFSCT